MVRFFRRLVVVLAVAALTGAAGYAFAQAAPLPVPVNIQPVGPAPGGLSTMATFDARGVGGASNAGYYTRPVLVSNNTLGGLARGLLRRSAPVAAMALAIEAAGWAIDELTGQVYAVPPTQPGMTQLGMPVWRTSNISGCGGNGCYVNSASEALALAQSKDTSTTWTGTRQFDGSAIAYVDNIHGFPAHFVLISISATQQYQKDPSAVPTPGVEPTPQQWGDLVNNNPQLWNDILRNPDGSVNRNPDVMAEAERLRDALTNPDPNTNPAPDPAAEWDTGHQGGNPQPGASDQPWPAICEWAPNLCAWLDWTKQEPVWEDEDDGLPLPVQDPLEDMPSFNPGLGSGSCPAPQEVATFVGTISIPFDIFCGLASALYPLVLAAAYLTGAFIIVGLRRG